MAIADGFCAIESFWALIGLGTGYGEDHDAWTIHRDSPVGRIEGFNRIDGLLGGGAIITCNLPASFWSLGSGELCGKADKC